MTPIDAKMKTRYLPFSNGTSAMLWQEQNCDNCKRRPCAARNSLMRCDCLTLKSVQLCGGRPHVQVTPKGAFANLPARCAGFTTVSKRRDPGKNTPWLLDGGESF